ncbi:MAG: galactokinase family protein [Gemmatimonadota bacterium]
MSPAAAAREGAHLDACDVALGTLGAGRRRWSIWVPGRIELFGKHTDYAGGRSLLCAVERGFVVRAALRGDPHVRAIDARTGETWTTALGDLDQPAGDGWGRYVDAVVRRLSRNFPAARRGVDLAFHSDLPVASGMSSSSALIISVFVSLAKSNDLRSAEEFRREISSREELSAYLGCIENGESFRALEGVTGGGVGTQGGSQDHTAIMCAEPGRAVQYSFAPVRREAVWQLPPALVLVVAFSGVAAEKSAGSMEAYNFLAATVRSLVRLWNSETGRSDATLADAVRSGDDAATVLRGLADGMGERDRRRLDQFLLESFELVPAAGAALGRGDLNSLGEIAHRSQRAAEEWLGNQVAQTVSLVGLAKANGAVAASAFGAGFGGSVWALVPVSDALAFAARWNRSYGEEFPAESSKAMFMISPAGPGAMQW